MKSVRLLLITVLVLCQYSFAVDPCPLCAEAGSEQRISFACGHSFHCSCLSYVMNEGEHQEIYVTGDQFCQTCYDSVPLLQQILIQHLRQQIRKETQQWQVLEQTLKALQQVGQNAN